MDGAGINWQAVSAIATIFMTVATFGAVIVALWSTVYVNKKRIKLTFSAYGTIVGTREKFISVTVINTGNRDVIIKRWGVLLEKPHGIAQILENNSNPIRIDIPHRLVPEESIDLIYPLRGAYKLFSEGIKDGKISKVKFFVDTGSDKRKIIKSKDKAEDLAKALHGLLSSK